ncbi:MAG: glutathione S-transferase family protein [Paracoccaceae bacterium]
MTELILYDHIGSICSQMARLALVEKGLTFRRRQIDIMEMNEQFEPWYVALNPRAVVPTLQIGDEIVTDTIRIVNRVEMFDGSNLAGDETTESWLKDIMSLHYGVLLYRNRLDPDGTAPQIIARGAFLEKLANERPDLAETTRARLEGNRRFQQLLQEPEQIQQHLNATRALVDRMVVALSKSPYLAGKNYSLADCFATAALARFTIHQLGDWWLGTPLEEYYQRMRRRPSFVAVKIIDTGTERDL